MAQNYYEDFGLAEHQFELVYQFGPFGIDQIPLNILKLPCLTQHTHYLNATL